MNKYLIRLQTLFNFCEPSSSQLPVPNEKMGAAIASNDSKIKVDPELLPKDEALNEDTIVQAPIAATSAIEILATKGGNETHRVVDS